MSEKTYTPVEIGVKVLDKVKELAKACSMGKTDPVVVAKVDEQVVAGAPQAIESTKIGKPNKLEEFIANKKAKKTAQIEKALGMNGPAKQAGSPGALPLASPVAAKPPKVAVPAMGTPNKKV